MPMELIVEGDDALKRAIEAMNGAISDCGEGLMDSLSLTFQDVQEVSQTVWNVRTGLYSTSWQMNRTGAQSVEIVNYAPYAAPLETGWVLKNGRFKESPGVLLPTVINDADSVAQELTQWLREKMALLLKIQ